MFKKYLFGGMLFTMASVLFTACSAIDDDLSDCQQNFQQNFSVHYQVRLKTTLTTQVETVLRSRFNEPEVATLLEDSLKNIFREFAHDVDLSFYINEDRRQYKHAIMDDNQAVYEMELPADDYRHLALANFMLEPTVDVSGGDKQKQHYIQQTGPRELNKGHNAGLFTARANMNVLGNIDQTFNVTLYMVNSASILLIRTDGVDYKDVKVTSSDFADGFYVDDSLFTYNNNRVVNDLRVTTPPVEREVFYAITFPSCDTPELAQTNYPDEVSRADGSTGATDEDRVWRKTVYVTLPDGKITRTVINVHQPLLAGQVSIIYCYMKPDGGIWSPNVEVGTSVTFDWKEGLVIEDGR